MPESDLVGLCEELCDAVAVIVDVPLADPVSVKDVDRDNEVLRDLVMENVTEGLE